MRSSLLLSLSQILPFALAFSIPKRTLPTNCHDQVKVGEPFSTNIVTSRGSSSTRLCGGKSIDDADWTSDYDDFDDFIIDDDDVFDTEKNSQISKSSGSTGDDESLDDTGDEDLMLMDQVYERSRSASASQQQPTISSSSLPDATAIRTRQFLLGEDLVLDTFVGNMGFDEVTDWEYYYPDEDGNPENRKVVQPNPFESGSQPKRTRTSSGSVIRIFRGELVGPLGGLVSAQGLDRRVLVKEYTGRLALQLAGMEIDCVGNLQSDLQAMSSNDDNKSSQQQQARDWLKVAAARRVLGREDNSNVAILHKDLKTAPYLGILGCVDLAELEDNLEPNEFYRALGVAPPKPDAVWVVYEYAGLSSLQAYTSKPLEERRRQLPVGKGFFGNPVPNPALPDFDQRARYVIQGIIKQAIVAVANLHEHNMIHKSIGRSSLLLASRNTMDASDVSSVYATDPARLTVKLTDFGFSGELLSLDSLLDRDPEFAARARTFGLTVGNSKLIATTNFALAEDFHALGFVFLGLMLTTLAEQLPNNGIEESPLLAVPPTDEDTLQRLLGDIFNKDVRGQFREYVKAEDCWGKLVDRLDENDGAGWTVLETLLLGREKAAAQSDTDQIFSIRGLLTNPFFQ